MKKLAIGVACLLLCVGIAQAQNKSGTNDPIPDHEDQPIAEAPDGLPPLIGQYSVNDGPNWNLPTTVAYTCQEGCVEVFGGSPSDYSCSTASNTVDHMAWASSWGSPQHCIGGTPVAEDFKIGGPTQCGSNDCYKSAYVTDHCGSDSVNFCFAAQGVPTMPGAAKIVMVMLLLTAALISLTWKSAARFN